MSSLLTRTRPDIWAHGIALATGATGLSFVPKLPLSDGTIYACGGSTVQWVPPGEQEPVLRRRRRREPSHVPGHREPTPKHIRPDSNASSVFVPEGAMEWLLHEVGHYVAASPEERLLRNYGVSESEYGHDGEREWQAWAFEEIVLAPFGPSRLFAPPSQRDGAAYARSGPMPAACLRHVERQIEALGLDVERWRVEWGEWVRWGTAMGAAAPWRSVN
ncbi:MAG TPA: hypothetical protein VNV25_25280 [Gemmatimonadaceae bacterium]|nr:hypothetical protein [Gemmatimonadaceae bacterium]